MFSFSHQLTMWHCPHLLLCAMLQHCCCWLLAHWPHSSRSMSPGCQAHSSKPAAVALSGRMGQTDRWTVRHPTVAQILLHMPWRYGQYQLKLTSQSLYYNSQGTHRAVSPSGTVRMCSFCISSIVPIVSVLSVASARLHNSKYHNQTLPPGGSVWVHVPVSTVPTVSMQDPGYTISKYRWAKQYFLYKSLTKSHLRNGQLSVTIACGIQLETCAVMQIFLVIYHVHVDANPCLSPIPLNYRP